MWDIIDEETRLLRTTYQPGAEVSATCCAVGMGDGALLLLSPAPDAGSLYGELEAYGKVVAIVAPNGFHRHGLYSACNRFPEAGVYSPESVINRVQKAAPRPVLAVDALQPHLPQHVRVFVPPHLNRPDTMAQIHTTRGAIWYLNDLVLNIDEAPKNPFRRLLLSSLGFETGLAVNHFGWRWVIVANRKAFADWFLAELAKHPPTAIVAGHGPAVLDPEVLARLPGLVAEARDR